MGTTEESGGGRPTRNRQKLRTPNILGSPTMKSHSFSSSPALKQAPTMANVKTTTVTKADIEKLTQKQAKRIYNIGATTVVPVRTYSRDNTIELKAKDEETTDKSADDCSYSYKCPKCFKRFPNHENSLKHIQAEHCVNKYGAAVLPHSPHLVRLKRCLKCNMECTFNRPHKCKERKPDSKPTHEQRKKKESSAGGVDSSLSAVTGYVCAACDAEFEDMSSFDQHVPDSHPTVKSFFFSTFREYNKWKSDMEMSCKCLYQMRARYGDTKHFRCMMGSSKTPARRTDNLQLCCPSTIVLQEYMTGIQLNLYSTHAGHEFKPYTLPTDYKKNSISHFIKPNVDFETPTNLEDDLYLQFKTLMETVVTEAAKLDKSNLRTLYGRALAMTMVVNNYAIQFESDEEVYLGDDEISQLEDDGEETEPDRDAPEPDAVVKQPVAVVKQPVAVVKQPVAVVKQPVAVEKKPIAVVKQPVVVEKKQVAVVKPPAAVDKQPAAVVKQPVAVVKQPVAVKKEPVAVKRDINHVVGKKIVKMINSDDEIQRIEDVRSSQRLKRKLGEDATPVQKVLPIKRTKKPEILSESKRDSTPEQEFCQVTTNATIEATPKTTTDDVDNKSENEDDTTKLKSKTEVTDAVASSDSPKLTGQSPSKSWQKVSFADQYKDFVKKNFNKERAVKKDNRLRTKLGQFKPSLSPQKGDSKSSKSPKLLERLTSPKKKASGLKSPVTKVTKIDRYEVKERKNGCNILILKI